MSRMNFYLRLAAAWLLVVSALWASPSGYTSIYVFGDGVSTTTQNPPPAPSNLYNGARFCDGLVWVEVLSQSRGITYVPAKNISYYEHFSNLMVTSVNNLAAPADAATSLFMIWCANADFVKFVSQDSIPPNNANLTTWQNAIAQSVNNHVTAVNTLRLNKGAKVIVLPTAADIMKVPFFSDSNATEKAFIRARIVEFNNQLASAMNNLVSANPGLTIVMPDVFAFLDQVLANPSAYGMRNPSGQNVAIYTTDPWNQSRDFVFWDEEHPTAMFQAALANYINGLIPTPDTVPPVLTLPNPAPIVEALGPGGAVVNFTTSANDAVDGPVATTANPPSGSTFPLGNTTVTVSASDAAGNTATGNFTVTVRDTTPPVITMPADKVVAATSPSGTTVSFTTSATDTVSGSRPTTANPPSGSLFPVGTNTVNVSASDAAGNQANGSFKVTVVNMNGLLSNVAISPAGSGFPGISGLIQGGPPNGQVILQASSDLGKNDLWQDIGTIQLDASGSKSFGPISDPQGMGLNRNFYRIKLPLSP